MAQKFGYYELHGKPHARRDARISTSAPQPDQNRSLGGRGNAPALHVSVRRLGERCNSRAGQGGSLERRKPSHARRPKLDDERSVSAQIALCRRRPARSRLGQLRPGLSAPTRSIRGFPIRPLAGERRNHALNARSKKRRTRTPHRRFGKDGRASRKRYQPIRRGAGESGAGIYWAAAISRGAYSRPHVRLR